MKTPLFISLVVAAVLPCTALAQQTYKLNRVAFGSVGGVMPGSPFSLGMTVGQSVTGMGAGPMDTAPKTYAEAAGFWMWGHLPVLDVYNPGDASAIVRFALFPNTPNPFSLQTLIKYAIPVSAGPTPVTVRLYDLLGRQIRVLDEGLRDPGMHVTRWDGSDEVGHPVAGGIYFYRIQAGSFVDNRRLALIR